MSPTEPDVTTQKPAASGAEGTGGAGCGLMFLAALCASVLLIGLGVGIAGVVPALFFAALGGWGVYGTVQEARRREVWGRVVVAALLGVLAVVSLLAALRSLLTPWPFG